VAVAAVLGALVAVAATPAWAQAVEPQQNSLQDAVDGFVAYLKSETYDAAAAAGKIVRDNKDTVDAAKASINSQFADLRAALSDQKASVETLARDAAKRFEAWSKSAAPAWTDAERVAQDILDRFAAWMRSHSPPEASSQTPV
jgi:hypothetical protein